MKKRFLIPAILFWVASLVLITLILSLNPPKVVQIDLSQLQAGQIIAGTNLIEGDYECSHQTFMSQTWRFDLILVGVDREESGELIFLGREPGWEMDKWYRTSRKIPDLGWYPEAKEVRLSDDTLIILYGKDVRGAIIFLILIVVVGGLFGWLFFEEAKM